MQVRTPPLLKLGDCANQISDGWWVKRVGKQYNCFEQSYCFWLLLTQLAHYQVMEYPPHPPIRLTNELETLFLFNW